VSGSIFFRRDDVGVGSVECRTKVRELRGRDEGDSARDDLLEEDSLVGEPLLLTGDEGYDK
jgi:hypothetical protein